MASVGKLNILVGATLSPLKKGLGQATGMVKSFSAGIGSMVGGLGAVVGFGAVTVGLKSAAAGMDEVLKASETLGISTENLIGLKHAAAEADVPFETLTNSIFKMEDGLATAAKTGKGPAADALRSLRLSAKDLVNMRPDEAFTVIGDALNGVGNAAQRNSLAMDIFGKSAAKIDAVLRLGGEGVHAATQETQRLGMSFSAIDAKKVDAAGDAIGKLGSAIKGAAQQTVIRLAPAIEKMATSAAFTFADTAKAVGNFVDEAGAEIGFFVGNWDLNFKIAKLKTFQVLNEIGAFFVATFDATLAGFKAFTSNWQNIITDLTHTTVLGDWIDSFAQHFISALDGIAAVWEKRWSILSGEANPFTIFQQTFDKTMGDIKSSFPEVLAQTKGALQDFGGKVSEEFSKSFSGSIDKDLGKQLNAALDELGQKRLIFDLGRLPAGLRDAAAKPETKGAFEGAIGSISAKTAGAAQIGSAEAFSAIIASMRATAGGDNSQRLLQKDVDANERTARGVEDLARRDPITFNVINSFV